TAHSSPARRLGAAPSARRGLGRAASLRQQLLDEGAVALGREHGLELAVEAHRRLDALVSEEPAHRIEAVRMAVEVELGRQMSELVRRHSDPGFPGDEGADLGAEAAGAPPSAFLAGK